MASLLKFERAAWRDGLLLLGIDEVGRGPLAGPVVAAAVIFPVGHRAIKGVRDSKLVRTHEERVDLVEQIRTRALAWGLGAASVREIARHNIRQATILAMRRALTRCRRRIPVQAAMPHCIYIDGLPVPELGEEHQALVKGDGRCHAIAAASLLAKVSRDSLMIRLHRRRPDFGWQTNSGYGTPAHIAALRAHGMTPHHRLQFCDTALQTALFNDELPGQPAEY